MTSYYVILEKRSYTREDTQLHTLISYVLLPPWNELCGCLFLLYAQMTAPVSYAPVRLGCHCGGKFTSCYLHIIYTYMHVTSLPHQTLLRGGVSTWRQRRSIRQCSTHVRTYALWHGVMHVHWLSVNTACLARDYVSEG